MEQCGYAGMISFRISFGYGAVGEELNVITKLMGIVSAITRFDDYENESRLAREPKFKICEKNNHE